MDNKEKRPYQVCKCCVMDTTDESITFDENLTNMDTKAFLEQYKEIEDLIETNWELFYQAYNIPKSYSFDEFTVDCDSGEVVIKYELYCRGENDDMYIDVPLEWFESDGILTSYLNEAIKKNEEEELRKKKEEEEMKARREEDEKAIRELIAEYYKTHPRKPVGGNYN